MTRFDARRRSREAALLQLAAEILRRNTALGHDTLAAARDLERSAAQALAGLRRDPAAAV
jgi:hypothetical protein